VYVRLTENVALKTIETTDGLSVCWSRPRVSHGLIAGTCNFIPAVCTHPSLRAGWGSESARALMLPAVDGRPSGRRNCFLSVLNRRPPAMRDAMHVGVYAVMQSEMRW